MSEISLSSTMKNSLLSLQNTQSLYDQTQERLVSGKRVNNPVDDPANYYAAATLTNRASALEGRIDGMAQAVQSIKAADNGIEAMKSILESMQAVAESAMSTAEDAVKERQALGTKYNELLVQLESFANDSAYGGINLLKGEQTQTVQLGEKFGDSTFTVEGFHVEGASSVDSDGNVASVDAKNIPDSWGKEGQADAIGYAFVVNSVQDPTDVTGIKSYSKLTDEQSAYNDFNEALDAAKTAADGANSTDMATAYEGAQTAAAAYDESILQDASGQWIYGDSVSEIYINSLNDIETGITGGDTIADVQATIAAKIPKDYSITEDGTGAWVYSGDTAATDEEQAYIDALNALETQEDDTTTPGTLALARAALATTAGSYDSTIASSAGAWDYTHATPSDKSQIIIDSLNTLKTQVDGGVTTYNSATIDDDQDALIAEDPSTVSRVDWSDSVHYREDLSKVLEGIEKVGDMLDTRAKLLSYDQSTISLREDYTSEFVLALEDGSDKLTAADMNEEAANLLALQTSQQLGVQGLSLANQQTQNILQILG